MFTTHFAIIESLSAEENVEQSAEDVIAELRKVTSIYRTKKTL